MEPEEISYEFSPISVALNTDCPNVMNLFPFSNIQVGSLICQKCVSFVAINKKEQTIRCKCDV